MVEGQAYCAAGVFPWHGVFLTAFDTETGHTRWQHELEDLTAQGYMLASRSSLYLPTGRARPVVFERASGQRRYQIQGGGGGTYALLTGESLVYGPGKAGELSLSEDARGDQLASFKGNHMLVSRGIAYLHSGTRVSALNRTRYLDLARERKQVTATLREDQGLLQRARKENAPSETLEELQARIDEHGQALARLRRAMQACLLWDVPCDAPFAIHPCRTRPLPRRPQVRPQVARERWKGAREAPRRRTRSWPCRRPWCARRQYRYRRHPCIRSEVMSHAHPKCPVPFAQPHLTQTRLCLVFTLLTVMASAQGQHATHVWRFEPDGVQEEHLPDLGSARPPWPLRLHGTSRFVNEQGTALVFDGQSTHLRGPEDMALPRERFTIAATVFLHETQAWGGILSALQDNGEYERGFLLGYRHQRLTVGVASESPGRFQYLDATTPFAFDTWIHVVGTYDGKTLTLYADGEVVARSETSSGPILPAEPEFFTLGAYRDDNEFYPLNGMLGEVLLDEEVWSQERVRAASAALRRPLPVPRDLYGPFLEVRGPIVRILPGNRAHITFELEETRACTLQFEWPQGGRTITRSRTSPAGRTHAILVEDLPENQEVSFRIHLEKGDAAGALDDAAETSEKHRFDTTFLYLDEPVKETIAWPPRDRPARDLAATILEQTESREGYALVLGLEAVDAAGELPAALALASRFKVIVLEDDPARVQAARQNLDAANLLGDRVSILQGTLREAQLAAHFANVIVAILRADQPAPADPAAVLRVLRPEGGLAYFESHGEEARRELESWAERFDETQGSLLREADPTGVRFLFTRFALAGAGDWNHQYASPNNSACSEDERVSGPLDVQWWGRPGPRPMPDRGPRNPAPLYCKGTLYVQGNRTLFALDAYNGTILWSQQWPALRRANVPRDSSNMVATERGLWVAQGSHALLLARRTGEILERLLVDPENAHWGVLMHTGGRLFGTRTGKDAVYLGDQGEWFNDDAPDQTARVLSHELFAYDQTEDGSMDEEPTWSHSGTILNATLGIQDGVIFFLESRSPELKDAARATADQLKTNRVFLVALDARDGSLLWQQAFDGELGAYVTYANASGNTLLVTNVDAARTFHLSAFDLRTGTPLWQRAAATQKTHHSGWIHHPTLVGDSIHVNKFSYGPAQRRSDGLRPLRLPRLRCDGRIQGHHLPPLRVPRHVGSGEWRANRVLRCARRLLAGPDSGRWAAARPGNQRGVFVHSLSADLDGHGEERTADVLPGTSSRSGSFPVAEGTPDVRLEHARPHHRRAGGNAHPLHARWANPFFREPLVHGPHRPTRNHDTQSASLRRGFRARSHEPRDDRKGRSHRRHASLRVAALPWSAAADLSRSLEDFSGLERTGDASCHRTRFGALVALPRARRWDFVLGARESGANGAVRRNAELRRCRKTTPRREGNRNTRRIRKRIPTPGERSSRVHARGPDSPRAEGSHDSPGNPWPGEPCVADFGPVSGLSKKCRVNHAGCAKGVDDTSIREWVGSCESLEEDLMLEIDVTLKGRPVGTFSFNQEAIMIGRDPGSDIHLDNAGVSRRHAQIVKNGDRFEILDVGSSNGTFVNGYPAAERVLDNGDVVQVGKFSLTCLMLDGDGPATERKATQSQGLDLDRFQGTIVVDGDGMSGGGVPMPQGTSRPSAQAAPPKKNMTMVFVAIGLAVAAAAGFVASKML